jgi:hypothetical protein
MILLDGPFKPFKLPFEIFRFPSLLDYVAFPTEGCGARRRGDDRTVTLCGNEGQVKVR